MTDLWQKTDAEVDSDFARLSSEHPALYPVIGSFIRWFGEVEIQIDRNIMHLLRLVDDFEIYGMLAANLSPKSKVSTLKESLRRASKNSEIGDNLSERLDFFDSKIIKLRNHICHSILMFDGENVHFASTLKMKDATPIKQRPSKYQPPSKSLLDIKRYTVWLAEFHSDLDRFAAVTWTMHFPKMFEIDAPRSTQPHKESPLTTAGRSQPASPHKP